MKAAESEICDQPLSIPVRTFRPAPALDIVYVNSRMTLAKNRRPDWFEEVEEMESINEFHQTITGRDAELSATHQDYVFFCTHSLAQINVLYINHSSFSRTSVQQENVHLD